MQRTPRLALLFLLALAAPALAANAVGHAGDCPLAESATAEGSDDKAQRSPAASEGAAVASGARGPAVGATPRTRSRWQSLVPGMMK
jgi:hypothetical protein